jgi:hypothetical protein
MMKILASSTIRFGAPEIAQGKIIAMAASDVATGLQCAAMSKFFGGREHQKSKFWEAAC